MADLFLPAFPRSCIYPSLSASLPALNPLRAMPRPTPSLPRSLLDRQPSSYRSTTNVNLPFRVQPIVEEIGKSRVDYTVHVKANFPPKLSANNVIIKIPTPLNTTKVDCKVAMGKAKYVPAENVIIWK